MATQPQSFDAAVQYMQDSAAFEQGLKARNLRGRVWQGFFSLAIVIGLLALLALVLNIVDRSFGYVIISYQQQPAEIGAPADITSAAQLAALDTETLAGLIESNLSSSRLLTILRDSYSLVPADQFTTAPVTEVFADLTLPPDVGTRTVRELTPEELRFILINNLDQDALFAIVDTEVLGREIEETFNWSQGIFNYASLETALERYPDSRLEFRSWLSADFITSRTSNDPVVAGIRTAIIGSVWVITITILFAFPVGVGAAIYLEEYASHTSRIAKVIETNIRNLAGVPSIIYGLLGLAIFVRTLDPLTGGRTILAAGATMALLVLPVVIINAQEALRAVPSSIREGSYGMGATKWQTIWRSVLPAAIPGILTGTILAMSRAIGETAPLIVIGASTFIPVDPSGPFSKFTVLPIQIFDWTSRPQPEFRSAAAAAIIVLLALLLTLNATAIILRQRFRRKLLG